MKVIGVTGGIGAGKSVACAMFAECGGTVIDADKIAREVMEQGRPAYSETVSAFGKDILQPDGEIDRKELAAIVFSDSARLEKLNAITHKHIFEEMRRRLDEIPQEGIAVLDVPLLFSSDFPFDCDRTVAVLAEREVRIARVKERDGMDRESVLRRMSSQLSDEEYRRLADVCIDNSDGADILRRQVQKIYDSVRNETGA